MAKKRGQLPRDVRAILAGRIKVGIDDLVEAIREVNPTAAGLSARDEAARYEEKAALQNLLIRQFPDEVGVTRDDSTPGVVLLRLKFTKDVGTHAVLSNLDEHARHWIDVQLEDVEDVRNGGTKARTGRPAAALSNPLARAAAAVEAYDYEEAKSLLETSLAEPHLAIAAATMLLELLSDTLGTDNEAVERAERFPPEVLENPAVRALVATAMARSAGARPDTRARAERLLHRIESPRATEAMLALAEAALSGDDLRDAARFASYAEQRGAPAERLRALHDRVDRRKAELRAPEEAALLEFATSAPHDVVERRAKQLLERWPESREAALVLERLSADATRARLDSTMRAANEARARGDITRLDALLHESLTLGAAGDLREAIATELRERARQAQEQREAQLVSEMTDRVRKRVGADTLSRYAELETSLRQRVRVAIGAGEPPELDWLDLLLEHSDPGLAVRAAMALREARASVEQSPENALLRLEPFRSQLAPLNAYREVCATAERNQADRVQAATEAALRDIEAALAVDAAPRATTLAAGLTLRHVPVGLRDRAQRLTQLARDRTHVAGLTATLAALEASGRLSPSIRLAEDLVSATSAGERERWDRHLGLLRTRLHQLIPTWDFIESGGADALRDLTLPTDAKTAWSLDGDGRLLYFAQAFGRDVFVRAYDLATHEIAKSAWLVTPAPIGRVETPVVRDGQLWLVGEAAFVLVLDATSLRTVRWHPPEELGVGGTQIENVLLAPDARHAWIQTRADGPFKTRVVRLDDGAEVREVSAEFAEVIYGGVEPSIAAEGRKSWRLFDSRGSVRTPISVGPGEMVLELAAHPTGAGYVALVGEFSDEATEGPGMAKWAEVTSAGTTTERTTIDGTNPEGRSGLATSTEQRRAFAWVERDDDSHELVVLEPSDSGRLREGSRARTTGEVGFVSDVGSRRVAAVRSTMGGVQVLDLKDWQAARETLERPAPTIAGRFPIARGEMFGCVNWEFETTLGSEAQAPPLQSRDLRPASVRVDEIVATDASEAGVERGLALRQEIYRGSDYPARARLEAWLMASPSTRPEVVLARAAERMRLADRAGVIEALEKLDRGTVGPSGLQHVGHLLGTAYLHLGRVDEARAELVAASAISLEGGCSLGPLLELCAPPPAGRGPWEGGGTLGRALAEAMFMTDDALARGDAARAIDILDRPPVWHTREVQSLARLATAYLALDPPLSAARRKVRALAEFVEAATGKPDIRRETVYPWGAWDDERIARVSALASEWLAEARRHVLSSNGR